MRRGQTLSTLAALMLLSLSSCSTQATHRRTGARFPSDRQGFVIPYDASVYLSPAGGTGAAISEFGTCTDGSARFEMLFKGLPVDPVPAGEIGIGTYGKGSVICFCMKTAWRANEHWAFSSQNDALSQIVFRDLDGSLRLRGGSILKRVTADMWMLHLDDAASFMYDDNDHDVLIRIRLEKKDCSPHTAAVP